MNTDQIVDNPEIMLVGEAWGAEEEIAQQPFIGRSGQQLNRLLLAANIDRAKCYITNVVNERPEKNNFGIYYQDNKRNTPTDKLLLHWQELRTKIENVRPKIVIGLGNEALRALLQLEGIETYRGSLYEITGSTIKVLCTFHPSAIIRGGQNSWYLPLAIHDLKSAKRIIINDEHPFVPQLKLIENAKELDDFFLSIPGRECAFDIETTMHDGEWITCIGFCYDGKIGHVVPLPQKSNAENLLQLIKVLKYHFEAGLIRWIGQNAYNFDIPFMRRVWDCQVKNYTLDTMVLHHVNYPEFPHTLKFLASFYTLIPYYKDTSESNLYQYNCNDVVATYQCAQKLIHESPFNFNLYLSYHHPLLNVLSNISMQGVRIDKNYQKELKHDLQLQITEFQNQLDTIYQRYTNRNSLKLRLSRLQKLSEAGRKTVKWFNFKTGKRTKRRLASQIKSIKEKIAKEESLNVRSSKALAKFLYQILELPVKTKNNKITTDETALNQLYIKTQHPFLKTMLKLRQHRNNMSRWGKLKTDQDGLITTTYSFAETGRLKSGRFNAK